MKKRKQKTRGIGPAGPKRAYRTLAYPVEFRLRMVKLYLEQGYSTTMLREQFEVSGHSIHRWAKAYRLHGADRLGVSRKAYYKWEQRGLGALLDGVAEKSPGRPGHPSDDRHHDLERELREAKKQIELLNHKLALKDVLWEMKLPAPGCGRVKKK